jgi:dolichyl-phosphate beta-glucosyltransferase
LTAPYLSIIIPAHNEEHRLPVSLENLFQFLLSQPYTAEVLVVENGSHDQTFQVASDIAKTYQKADEAGIPLMRVLQEAGRGKGLAVRRGMLEANGKYRFMCDADFSMPVEEISRFIPPQKENADLVIASREITGAVRYGEPAFRHLVGRIYNFLIRLIILPGLHDTQCGFKCFRDEVAVELFQQQKNNGWSFDVEVLFIAQQRGYNIEELPIPWHFNPESKINVLRDALRMFIDLIHIRLNWHRGTYQGADLPELHRPSSIKT